MQSNFYNQPQQTTNFNIVNNNNGQNNSFGMNSFGMNGLGGMGGFNQNAMLNPAAVAHTQKLLEENRFR